ncbi:hypothetical protein ABBQ38_010281 [Trebouxia sp. C0009 RCD-2024]
MVSASHAASRSISKLQEASNVLTSSLQSSTKATPGEQAPSKQELQTLIEGLKLEASKVGLMWGNNTPSHAEAESLLAGLEQRHSQLLTLLCRAGFSAGPTLLNSLQSAASPVTAACVHLLNCISSDKHGEVAVPTGKVWAACDAAGSTALDNKTAIGRKLLHISRSVKDNIREVQDVISESRLQTSEQQPAHDLEHGSDVDLDFETEPLRPGEIESAEAALSLIQAVLDILKLLVRVILTEQDVSGETTIDDWESLLFHAKSLADVSNDLAAALFAPQDKDEVVSATDSLQTGCELVLDEIPDRLRTPQTDILESLAHRVSCAHNSVMTKLSVDMSTLSL